MVPYLIIGDVNFDPLVSGVYQVSHLKMYLWEETWRLCKYTVFHRTSTHGFQHTLMNFACSSYYCGVCQMIFCFPSFLLHLLTESLYQRAILLFTYSIIYSDQYGLLNINFTLWVIIHYYHYVVAQIVPDLAISRQLLQVESF